MTSIIMTPYMALCANDMHKRHERHERHGRHDCVGKLSQKQMIGHGVTENVQSFIQPAL